jgi:hypothetical protein
VELILQIAFTGMLCRQGILRYSDAKSTQLKELDYYARTEQWDRIPERCKGPQTNYLYLCYLNIALMEKGQLADRMFSFDQHGLQGLMITWNKTFSISSLLSDFYFTLGEIAPAQRMAFEAYVSTTGEGSARHLKRLIQTNLIYGRYAVAEKYISLLEKTFYYRNWAKAHRKFLYNDAAVESDDLLGSKRRLLPVQNTLAHINGIEADLIRRVEQTPSDVLPVHYMGAAYLLSKDMDSFRKMVEKYYNTPVLPVLPLSFREAVAILSENDPHYGERFNLPASVSQRFLAFKKGVQANRNNKQLSALLKDAYGDTYWYYYLFK